MAQEHVQQEGPPVDGRSDLLRVQRAFPGLVDALIGARARFAEQRLALAGSGFAEARRRSRTVVPLTPAVVSLDAVHVLAAEPADPAWSAFVDAAGRLDDAEEAVRDAVLDLGPPDAPPEDPAPEPPDLLAPAPPIGAVDPDGTRTVAERLWLDDSDSPRLWVQTLRARPRTAADPRDLPGGWPEETIGWLLTRLHAAGLGMAEWVPLLTRQPEDMFALDDTIHLDAAPGVDPDPVYAAVDELERTQRSMQRAEAERVQAAVRVWRTAMEQVAGTRDAAINGPYWKSITLQLAHSLRVAETTAASLVHTAEDLESRLPRTWALFLDGQVPWRAMQAVHAAQDGLDPEFRAAFDEGAVQELGRVEVPRLKDALRRLRERLQASTANERHRTAMSRRGVTVEPAADGMAWLHWYGPAPEAIALDGQLSKGAIAAHGVEGETRTIAQLRSDILIDLWIDTARRDATAENPDVVVPQRRGVEPQVCVLLPAMSAMGRSDAPAVLQGYGPIPLDVAKRLAGAAKSWIKVLTDPVTGAVITVGQERYRPTADMRTLLGLLDGGGRGPGCARPPDLTDADHVESFRKGSSRGETALHNLVLLSRRHHIIKTSGIWDIRLLADRTLVWISIWGTRIITVVPDPPAATPVPDEFLHPAEDPPPF